MFIEKIKLMFDTYINYYIMKIYIKKSNLNIQSLANKKVLF